MEHVREGDLIIARLDKGEQLMDGLLAALRAEGARGAVMVTALGAVEDVEVGFFDPKRKTFDRKVVAASHELLSLTGIIASGPDGAFQPHFHIVMGGPEHHALGGHLFRARIAVLGEFAMRAVYNPSMRREKEPEFGLNALHLK